jgi:putative endonuclease
MRSKRYFVYILANAGRSTLYIGLTCDLRRRLFEHQTGYSRFTNRYRVNRLIYFESHDHIHTARQRERTMKRWRRAWKENQINAVNPDWRDLSAGIPLD